MGPHLLYDVIHAGIATPLHEMSNPQQLFSTTSLQNLCLNQLIAALEQFSPELLCLIPPKLRYRLFIRSPIVDICRLEQTCAFDGINAHNLWGELYAKHWSRYDLWKYDCTVTSKSMESVSCGGSITNHEKYFTLLTTILFSAERPSGYFEYLEGDHVDNLRNNNVPEAAMNCYPTDIVNYLVAADVISAVSKRVEDVESSAYVDDAENCIPIYQRSLDDSCNDNRLSSNCDRIATKRQCIPQRYVSLVSSGSRLSDEDALSLIVNICNYHPKVVAFCASETVQWNWNQEKLRCLLANFFVV